MDKIWQAALLYKLIPHIKIKVDLIKNEWELKNEKLSENHIMMIHGAITTGIMMTLKEIENDKAKK